MAPAFQQHNSSSRNSLGSNSFTLTTSAGDAFAVIACQDDGNRTPTVNANGVTNGTQIFVGDFIASWKFFVIQGLAAGTHTINVNWGGGGVQSVCGGAIWSGFKGTGNPEAEGAYSSANPGSSASSAVTVATDQAWLIGVCLGRSTLSAGANTTLRADNIYSGGTYNVGYFDSNAGQATGSRSLAMSQSSSGELYFESMSVVQAPAARTRSPSGAVATSAPMSY